MFSMATDAGVFFNDPRSPCSSVANEKTSGLIR